LTLPSRSASAKARSAWSRSARKGLGCQPTHRRLQPPERAEPVGAAGRRAGRTGGRAAAAHLHNHPDRGFHPATSTHRTVGTPPRQEGTMASTRSRWPTSTSGWTSMRWPMRRWKHWAGQQRRGRPQAGAWHPHRRRTREHRLVRHAQAIVNLAGPHQEPTVPKGSGRRVLGRRVLLRASPLPRVRGARG
jgi:hypothetical protein